jgi:putative nucleotidyltransferase with HDIG domain
MTRPCEGYHLAERELWRHSLAAVVAAGKMSSYTSTPVPASAFTAALLHDFGKLMLARYHSPEVISRITALVENGKSYVEAERMVLGTDHAIVGGMAAKHWKFPQSLVNAIEFHHNPDADPDTLLDAVHVANIVAKILGIGLGSEQMNMEASANSSSRLGLSSASMEGLCAATLDELSQTEQLFEVR